MRTLSTSTLALAAALLGCGGFTTPPQQTTLGLAVQSQALSGGQLVTSDGTDQLVLTSVKVAIERIRLDAGGADEGEQELDGGPFLIALDLSGAPQTIGAGLFEGGSYTRVRVKLRHLQANDPRDAQAAAAAGEPFGELLRDGMSIIAEGTFNGAPFRFRTAADVEWEVPLSAPLEVRVGRPTHVTLVTDPAAWFREEGKLLDPTAAGNESEIIENIAHSFEGFEDEDHDGVDDD